MKHSGLDLDERITRMNMYSLDIGARCICPKIYCEVRVEIIIIYIHKHSNLIPVDNSFVKHCFDDVIVL